MLNNQVPTTVVNGFLGSGKTTIIAHLIDYLTEQKQKVAYVKNEIGATDLDAQLMRGKNIVSKELLNGCICCTLVGPFIAAIDELIDTYQPDRIIIESAGTADPASLALMIDNQPRLYRDGVLVIIDAVNFQGFVQIDEVTRRQAELTDLIVFNKVELVSDERKRQVVGYVRELNEKAPIVEAPQGKLHPELAFGLGKSEISLTEHPHSHHDEKADQINAFTYISDKTFTKAQFDQFLQNLPPNIFRVKGFVKFPDKLQVVNGVFKRFDYFEPADATGQQSGNKLIFIGHQAQQIQAALTTQLNNL